MSDLRAKRLQEGVDYHPFGDGRCAEIETTIPCVEEGKKIISITIWVLYTVEADNE